MNGDESSVLEIDINRKIVKLSPRFQKSKDVNILDIKLHPFYISTYNELNIHPTYVEEVFLHPIFIDPNFSIFCNFIRIYKLYIFDENLA